MRIAADGWQTIPLGEALTFQRGFDITREQQQAGPYLVFSSSGPKSTHSKFMVRGPGVIVGRKGSLGTVFYSDGDYWPHDTTLWIKDFHGNNPKFAYYFLQTMGFERYDAGASNPTLNRNHIHTIPVRWPPPLIQRRIGGILSAYDELIENSRRRIRILESTARALYREWFLHFRFPAHEKLPRIASPLGDIPKGWRVVKLGDLVSYNRRATKPGSHLDERKYVPIDCLPSKSLALLEAKSIDAAQSSLQLFDKGDILFGAMRPYLHKVAIAPFDGATRTTCFVFRPAQSEWSAFAALTVSAETTVAYANAHSQGATIPYAVWDGSLSEMPLVLPPDGLLRRFETNVAPMLARIAQFYFTLSNLRQTRDLLLPRLLSGDVTLPSTTS